MNEMTLICPGYLEAKSLQADGPCKPDYREWFIHPKLKDYETWIRGVKEAVDIDSPSSNCLMLLVRELPEGNRRLLFRVSYAPHGDLNGRRHVRHEVFLLEQDELECLLSGDFVAVADEGEKTFEITAGSGKPLPRQQPKVVQGIPLLVWANQNDADRMRVTPAVEVKAPKPETPYVRPLNNRPTRTPIDKGTPFRVKILLAVLFLALLGSGFCFYLNANEIGQLKARVVDLENQLSKVKEERQKYKESLEEWAKTRTNFEKNAGPVKLLGRELMDVLPKMLAALDNIDEPPKLPPTVAPRPFVPPPPLPTTNRVDAANAVAATNRVSTTVERPDEKSFSQKALQAIQTVKDLGAAAKEFVTPGK